MRWWLPVLVVVVFGGGLVLKIVSDSRENTLLCEAVNENRSTLRNLLVSARNNTPKDKLTKQAEQFYAEQIRAIRPLDCAKFDRDSLQRQRSKAPSKRAGRQPRTRGSTLEARKTPLTASAPGEIRPNPAPAPDRAGDARPPATTNPPQERPQRFPPPARYPSAPGAAPAPGPPAPPEPPRDPTIFEQVCAQLPDLAKRRPC